MADDDLIHNPNGGMPRLVEIMRRLRDPETGCPNSPGDEVSTIYGGRWDPALQYNATAGRRVEDVLGYMEEGSYGGILCPDERRVLRGGRDCGSTVKYDPNTYSQLHLLGLKRSDSQQYRQDAKVRKKRLEQHERARRMEVSDGLKKQQRCVEGSLVSLIALSVVALIIILVLVLRGT